MLSDVDVSMVSGDTERVLDILSASLVERGSDMGSRDRNRHRPIILRATAGIRSGLKLFSVFWFSNSPWGSVSVVE